MIFTCPTCQSKIRFVPKVCEAIKIEEIEQKPEELLSYKVLAGLRVLEKCHFIKIKHPVLCLEAWEKAFPDIDLSKEISRAEAWATAKIVRRSPKGWQTTLNFWFSKGQDNFKKGGLPNNDRIAGTAEPKTDKYAQI